MTHAIPLTQGLVALVDADDYDMLMQWKWAAAKRRPNEFCATRSEPRIDGRQDTVYMHRVIMGEPIGLVIDHINHDTLDNRRANLRACTHAENQRNRRSVPNTTSKYLGVCWYKQTGKWRAQIKSNGKKIGLGYFSNEADAAIAYNDAAKLYHGEFANLNSINQELTA